MKKQNILITVVIVVLLSVGIGINYYSEQNTVMLDDDGDPIPKATSQTAPPTPPPPTPTSPAGSSTQSSRVLPPSDLPSEIQIGNPKAPTTVALGYTMDQKTEEDPSKAEKVVQTLSNWVESHPDVKVKVVSEDLPKNMLTDHTDANVPLGLSVNGKPLPGLNANPGEGFTADGVAAALNSVK